MSQNLRSGHAPEKLPINWDEPPGGECCDPGNEGKTLMRFR
jgi:hypothetical protein